ncbi:MAG TPA: hypothetical protein VJN18_25105 [Polyangiaceae bacterium]|nr:hypothetical protein [Polyangiaceae bacterium]
MTGNDWLDELVDVTDEIDPTRADVRLLGTTSILFGRVVEIVTRRALDYEAPFSSAEVRRMQQILHALTDSLDRAAARERAPLRRVRRPS